MPWIHSTEHIFFLFRTFEELALAPKKKVALEFFTVVKYFLSFRIFEQLTLALKIRGAQKCFAVWNILFTFRIFEQFACAYEKQLPWYFSLYWTCIFYHSGFLSNFDLPWKTELPRNFSLYGIYLLHSEFLSNLRLPWKQSLLWNFSSPGGGGRPPPRTPMNTCMFRQRGAVVTNPFLNSHHAVLCVKCSWIAGGSGRWTNF